MPRRRRAAVCGRLRGAARGGAGDGRGARIGGVDWGNRLLVTAGTAGTAYDGGTRHCSSFLHNKNVYMLADVCSGSVLGVWFVR